MDHQNKEILKLINDSQDKGIETLKILHEQYDTLQRCNNYTENINKNIEISSDILGKIKHFFFPRKACDIEKIDKIDNINQINQINNINISSDNVNNDLEIGIQNLKKIALDINTHLDFDAKLLDKVTVNSDLVNRNINKMNKEF